MTTPYKLTLTACELIALRSVLDYLEDEEEQMRNEGSTPEHIGKSVEQLREALDNLPRAVAPRTVAQPGSALRNTARHNATKPKQ